jgi:hypothetical protein
MSDIVWYMGNDKLIIETNYCKTDDNFIYNNYFTYNFNKYFTYFFKSYLKDFYYYN